MVDRGPRRYWKTFGRRIDLDGRHSWLRAPVLTEVDGVVEDNWLRAEAERVDGRIEDNPEAGLLADIRTLGGASASRSTIAFWHHSSRLSLRPISFAPEKLSTTDV